MSGWFDWGLKIHLRMLSEAGFAFKLAFFTSWTYIKRRLERGEAGIVLGIRIRHKFR
jgi:hypothetical protein